MGQHNYSRHSMQISSVNEKGESNDSNIANMDTLSCRLLITQDNI